MGIRNILAAIEQCQKMAHHLNHDGNWNLAIAAREEYEALERAALAIAENWLISDVGATGDASLELMREIAKEVRTPAESSSS